MDNKKYLKFQISSKLPKLLGRESVSTETQALFELVKNSYDADAPQVTVTFKNLEVFDAAKKILEKKYREILVKKKSEHPTLPINQLEEIVKTDPNYVKQAEYVKKLAKNTSIIVEDTGKGMTLERLENKWMRIGTSKTEDEKVTEKNRIVVGEKGVGRFAVERLSHTTIITSYPSGQGRGIILETNWDEFEDSAKNVDQIRIPLRFISKNKNAKGLKIELLNLRDEWSVSKIEKFIEDLSFLVLPEEIDKNFPFKIIVKYRKKGREEIVNVGGGLLKKAPYHFIAELTSDSIVKFTTFQYMGDKVIPNERGLTYENLTEEFPFVKGDEKEIVSAQCGPVKFTFYGFPDDPSGKDFGWKKYYGEHLRDKIIDDAARYSGVRIYRDGFRVRPYGDPGNDWLSIDDDARNHRGRLGSKSVIGWITISSQSNPNILDTTTREKIIENDAFQDLRKFVMDALDVFYIFTERRRKKLVKEEEKKNISRHISKIRDSIVDNPSMTTLEKKNLLSTLNKIQENIVEEEERVETEKESMMDERNAYRNLASVGITTGVVAHEVRDYLRAILLHTGVLKRQAGKEVIDQEQVAKSLSYIGPSATNLLSYMELVGRFTSVMSSRKKEFREKKHLNLHDQFRSIVSNLKGILCRWDIEVENKIPHKFPRLKMFEADLQSILLNLLSNSIKSLKLKTDERKSLPKSEKNRIRLSARLLKDQVEITFSDNGIGIAPMDRRFVFDLFWTRTANRETVKSGSGLGLPIIKEIIGDYGGTIEIEDRSEFPTGVTFKILIPLRSIVKNG